MAVVVSTTDMTIQKNSSILVNVEEALADLIVVSYNTENKKFEGVLLDTQKGNLPFGVYSLHPSFSNHKSATGTKDDKLYSVSQRYTYQEPQFIKPDHHPTRKVSTKAKAQPRQKMTVRLRPRKVLCSNCKGICNENSENVDVSRKRKAELDTDLSVEHKSSDSNSIDSKLHMGSTLVPKLSRLQPEEISNTIKVNSKNGSPKSKSVSKAGLNKASEKVISIDRSKKNYCDRVTPALAFVDVKEGFDKSVISDVKTEKSEHSKAQDEGTFNSVFSSARTLKICFGEGEGTVVKIPAIVGDFNEDSGVSCDMSKPAKQADAKAAKKALKRAKKQAKKNFDAKSTCIQSPKHVGALSPRNNVSMNSPNIDILQKKHKHKMKHKRKNKLPKTQVRDENMSKSAETESINYFSDIKKHCLKQKLSINLRRMSSNSYECCSDQEPIDSESEDWDSDEVPEFPATSTEGGGDKAKRAGYGVSQGDIVWGKVVGVPWWPGRVLSVISSSRAHVAWYASPHAATSSLMPCDSLSPFLEDYKIRFNKKNKGLYKEAVKQATMAAKTMESHVQDPLASPTRASMPAMSPRPINVFS